MDSLHKGGGFKTNCMRKRAIKKIREKFKKSQVLLLGVVHILRNAAQVGRWFAKSYYTYEIGEILQNKALLEVGGWSKYQKNRVT